MNMYLSIFGFILVLILTLCFMKSEMYTRVLPNLDALSRNETVNKKNLPMHKFLNMGVPGWKWDKLYA